MDIDPTIKSALSWAGIVWRGGPDGSIEFKRITDASNFIVLRVSKPGVLDIDSIVKFTAWTIPWDSKLPTGYTRIATGPDYGYRDS